MAYIGSGLTRFNTADDLTVTDDAEIQGGLTVDTTTLVVDDANNRVGIGTSSPNNLLSLENGDLQIHETGSSDPFVELSVGGTQASPTQSWLLRVDNSDSDKFQLRNSTSNFNTLTADTSGQVGIGTTSPNAKLHISQNGPILALGSTGSTDPRIDFYDQGTTTIGATMFLDQSEDTLCILRTASGSATDGLRIDSSGRVTKPSQPAFQIKGISTSISAGGEVYDDSGDWDAVLLDVGSNFNTSNGRFTAPVAGNYFLNASQFCVQSTTGTYQGIRINKNGSEYGHIMYGYVQTAADETVAVSVVMPMAAGDYATVQCFIGNSGTQNGNRILFSGHLIG